MVTDGVYQLSIRLHGGGPYGVRLSGGGHEPLTVAKMHRRSKAMAAGVEVGDVLLAVNGHQCQHWTIDQAMDFINSSTPGHDVILHLRRNVRDVSPVLDTTGHQSSSHRPTQPDLDHHHYYHNPHGGTNDAVHSQHYQVVPQHFSSELSTTFGSRVAAPGEYARRHIAAVYFEAQSQPTTHSALVADWHKNDMNKDDYRRTAKDFANNRDDTVVTVQPRFTPSKLAGHAGEHQWRQAQQPMIWRPPSSLPAPVHSLTERPVSAPPFRGEPWSAAMVWNHQQKNDEQEEQEVFFESGEDHRGADTEVVIWSSKAQDSAPMSNHSPWIAYQDHDQPALTSWIPQREAGSLPVSHEVDFSSVTSYNRIGSEDRHYDYKEQDRPGSTPPEPPPRRRYLQRSTVEPATDETTPQSVDSYQPPYDRSPSNQPRGLGPRWPSSPALGGAHMRTRSTSGQGVAADPSPLFLRRVVVTGDQDDDVIDVYGLKRKKMFADSSFYEDPDQKYPTIEQQVKMAREVAHLLTSPSGPSGRGQQMFLKRQQMSSHWKPEPAPQLRPPPRRSGYMSEVEGLHRSRSTPVVHTLTSVEELEHLQTRAEKSRHDVLPPQLGARLAAELESTSVRGGSTVAGRMFARRRDRAERSVVPETPSTPARPAPRGGPSPPDTVVRQPTHRVTTLDGLRVEEPTVSKRQPDLVFHRPEVDSTQTDDPSSYPVRGARLAKMIELRRAAMTPWEAAAQYEGRVDPAFQHLDEYKAASSNITLDDFVDDEDNQETETFVAPTEPFLPATQYQQFPSHLQQPAESQHTAASGDTYSQFINPTYPYNYYSYDDNYSSSLQATTNGAVSGGSMDIDHRSVADVDWSRDPATSGGAWHLTTDRTANLPSGYRSVKFGLPF